MPTLYDDNFGRYSDSDDLLTQNFYREVNKRSVLKHCSRCNKQVRLLPQYSLCNPCTEWVEFQGGF